MDSLAGAVEDEYEGQPIVLYGRKIEMPMLRLLICAGVSVSAFLYST